MKYSWLLAGLLLSIGCESREKLSQNSDTYALDTNLKESLAIKIMDQEEEPRGLYDVDAYAAVENRKATCKVVQVYEFDFADDLHVQTRNKCRALKMNDTLHIRIFSPSGGLGANLKIADGKYTAETHRDFAPDLVIVDDERDPPKVEIQSKKLVLDKKSYAAGDSLFGYIYIRALVEGESKQYAQGYFRAKVGGRE